MNSHDTVEGITGARNGKLMYARHKQSKNNDIKGIDSLEKDCIKQPRVI